ncbi:MAG: DUF853 family protein [Neisseriaceae bacterium]|nr:DUF853 family protein [Neisseriaceae bacterium]MBP6861584.1 DUF853 family protein [Neisseriaceae bacterium]
MSLYPIAQSQDNVIIELRAKMANRHGLIAGATGTGKTVTLRKMAESFSDHGIPVFLVDVKGDLSGLTKAGEASGKVQERIDTFNLGPDYLTGFPVRFWDVFGQTGIPVRVTIASMGPMLLSRLLNLNDTQEGLLNLVFKVAEDDQMAINDLKDLRALLQNVASKAAEYRSTYGNVSAASVGAIQRSLLTLENEGGGHLFGKPALDLNDWLQTEGDKGVINVLNAEKLMQSPRLFSAFLLWMLTELFNQLPEVGDPDKPKFVMFFDEAHLLFDNASSALIDKVEQVVRLIRSKGVGVYFCTQNPLDLPDSILGQLGNRVQHALRAFTPRDQKAVKAAADTFRANPKFKVVDAISELGVGEALLSFLDEKGMPTPVERAFVHPPKSQLSPLSLAERDATYQQDSLYPHYKDEIDDESAFELVTQQQEAAAAQAAVEAEAKATAKTSATQKQDPSMLDALVKGATGQRKRANGGLVNDVAHQMGNTVYKSISKQITVALKNVLSSILGGKK